MTLDEIGLHHGTDKSSTRHNYLVFYEQLFGDKRSEFTSVLEIGVHRGDSVRMWAQWMPQARVVGVDIMVFDEPALYVGAIIETANAADAETMKRIGMTYGPFDFVVDDGSHDLGEQQAAMDALLPFVRPGGYYIIEDIPLEDPRFASMTRHRGDFGYCLAYVRKQETP